MLTWILYVVFTALHLLANYKAVTALVFDSLNDRRAIILVEAFTKQRKSIRPKDMAALEPVFVCKPLTFLPNKNA